MVWLEYQKSDGYVVKIHETAPSLVNENHGVIATEQFNVNDEFTYAIYAHLDENGNANGVFGAVQQAPAAQYMLSQLADKDNRISQLEQQLAVTQAALDYLIMGGA